MTTLAQNNAELASGLGEAAQELGTSFNRCRPANNNAPGSIEETLLAAFSRNYTYLTAIDPKKPQRFGIFDFTNTVVGDYFVAADGSETYFVSNMAPLQPILMIKCNQLVTIKQPPGATVAGVARPVGSIGKAGVVTNGPNINVVTLVSNWPASVLYSGRGPSTDSKLPADETSAQFTLLLPISLPVELLTNYIFEDDIGRRFVAIAAERSEGGWRVIANQALQ